MIEVVVSGFKSFRMVNLTSKTNNVAEGPKVYEDAELEALLDQDTCQTEEEQYDGKCFEWNIRFRSFTINAQFLTKNGGNLIIHLIMC